jgi:hypothetical protein
MTFDLLPHMPFCLCPWALFCLQLAIVLSQAGVPWQGIRRSCFCPLLFFIYHRDRPYAPQKPPG